MAKSKLRSKVVLTIAALLLVPLLLLCAEGVARLFARRLDPLAVFVASPQLRADTQGENTSGLFEFDPLLTWKLRGGLKNAWWDFTPVQTNSAGLRMDREIGTKSGVRILCLGDSVTFGYRVPLAADRNQPGNYDPAEKPYPALLEERLNRAYPGKQIKVLPLACPGYSSWQGLAWLRRDIEELKPDLVLACFGWNDARAAGLPDRATFPQTSGQVTIRRLMSRSQLLLNIAAAAQSGRARELLPDSREPRTSAAEYVDNFAQMNAVARGHNAWFGIILPVYRDPNTPGDYPEAKEHPGDPEEGARMAQYREQLNAAAIQQQVPHLAIPELMESAWPQNSDLFGERIHPNAAGHRLLAERLQSFVEPAIKALPQ